MTADGVDALGIPPLFTHLVNDTSLLRPRLSAPAVGAVVDGYLQAREARFGGIVGQLVCPVSQLPKLVAELAKRMPQRPVDVSLLVDTGLGGVPKALSTVLSRSNLLTPRSVETAAPPDVDDIWLERVSEFVPEDVAAVVEPRRPHTGDEPGTTAWIDAVRRVAEHGCTPKLRCGGPRRSDLPTDADIERFVAVAVDSGRGFTVLGMHELVRTQAQHGLLNLITAVARALAYGDVRAALASTDATALAGEVAALSDQAVKGVRELLSHCGTLPEQAPGDRLAELGLLTR